VAAPFIELCDRTHNSIYVAISLMWPIIVTSGVEPLVHPRDRYI